jgi:hypothetical protein
MGQSPLVDAKLISFGWIEIDGRRFDHDVVLEGRQRASSEERSILIEILGLTIAARVDRLARTT